ncbi:MAG: cell division protein ZapA [Cytophagaceae bacterium]
MEVLSIKIKIGDREYPMRVDATEEEKIRLAGKLINESLKRYKDQFGINDKQDLLAMVAFDSIVDRMKHESSGAGQTEYIYSKIDHLEKLITNTLSVE